MSNPLKPEARLLAKIGSIIVHVDEMLSADGHNFDRVALEALLRDPEVKDWLATMAAMAFVPQKRVSESAPTTKPKSKRAPRT